jgi:diguanylate cyclase (GGDEF)-like protein
LINKGGMMVAALAAWAAIVILVSPPPAAARPLVIRPDQNTYQLTPYLDVLHDPGGKLTIDQVAGPRRANDFKPYRQHILPPGSIKGALWLRFRLAGKRRGPLILEFSKEFIDQIDVYLPRPQGDGGGYRVIKSGMLRPRNPAMLLSRTPAVWLPSSLPDGACVYVRLASRFALGMVVSLYTPQGFDRQIIVDSYTIAILYGVIFGLALFNFFIFLSLRDRVYLYYVIFMLSMLGYLIILHGQAELLGLFGWRTGLVLFGILIGLVFFFGSLFSKTFLMTKKNAPFMDKLYTVFMVIGLVRIVPSLIGWDQVGNQMSQVMALLSPVVSLAAGAICLYRGFTPARFYLLAWTALTGCIVWHALVSFGLLPWSGLSSMMMIVGSSAEALLLSFALADRIRLLRREREEAQKRERRFRNLSLIDGLTGLYNNRFLKSKLDSEIEHAVNLNQPLCLAMMDVDDFKRFNDTYGHLEGDRVLTALAAAIRDLVRETDVACRYGGEEFVLIMPGTVADDALLVAERVRRAFNRIEFSPKGHPGPVRVSLSIGLARLGGHGGGDDLLKAADKALYSAKAQGKNQTVIAD